MSLSDADAQALDPEVETGSVCPGSRAGHLADLFRAAGIGDIVDSAVAVDVEHATFEDWWEPFTHGLGQLERKQLDRPMVDRGDADVDELDLRLLAEDACDVVLETDPQSHERLAQQLAG